MLDRRTVVLILAALAALIALSRLRTYHEPVDWDLGTYAVVAHELNHGKKLYAVVWDGSAGPEDHPIAQWIAENYTPERGATHRYPLLFLRRKEP